MPLFLFGLLSMYKRQLRQLGRVSDAGECGEGLFHTKFGPGYEALSGEKRSITCPSVSSSQSRKVGTPCLLPLNA
jgi:hypothetical protein